MPAGHSAHDDAPAVMLGDDGAEVNEHQRQPRNQRKIVAVVAGLGIAWLAFVGLARLASPDEVAEVPYAPAALTATAVAETGIPADEAEPESAARPTESDESRVGEARTDGRAEKAQLPLESEEWPAEDVEPTQLGTTLLGADSGPNVRIERLQRQMVARDSNAVLGYRTNAGLALIDARAGTAIVAPITTEGANDPFIANRTVLFRSGPETFAIDPLSLRVTLLADDSSIIVPATATPSGTDLVVTVAGEELRTPEPLVTWRWDVPDAATGEYRTPVNHLLVPAEGIGLLAVADDPRGNTQVAGSVSFEPFSDGLVRDAHRGGWIEEICSGEPLTAPGQGGCLLRMVQADGGVAAQPPVVFAQPGDAFLLSPDATSVLRYSTAGDADIFISEESATTRVTGAGLSAAAWDSNSEFVAWLDLLGPPELRLVYPEDRFWLTVDLADLGLPRPISPEIVVFAQIVADEQ